MLRIRQFALPHVLRSSSLACFFRYSRFGFSGSSTRHNSSFYGPVSAMTGRREVNARCSETGSGGIIPFRGRGATWFATPTIPNPSGRGDFAARKLGSKIGGRKSARYGAVLQARQCLFQDHTVCKVSAVSRRKKEQLIFQGRHMVLDISNWIAKSRPDDVRWDKVEHVKANSDWRNLSCVPEANRGEAHRTHAGAWSCQSALEAQRIMRRD